MDLQGQLAIDGRSLDRLKQAASKDPQTAVRQAASQFEAMFTQMLLKSMRDAMPKSGLFSSATEDLATSMLDQQLAQKVGNRPGGLADIIARQLSQRMGGGNTSGEGIKIAPLTVNQPAPKAVAELGNQQKAALAASWNKAANGQVEQAGFVRNLWSHAEQVQRTTGVRAEFVVGQAALESGWGSREIRHADGRSTHNLFGIKAGSNWNGPVAEVTTTEYVGGVARKQVEKFRAYGSYQEAFADWSRLIAGKGRYGEVLKQGAATEANTVQGYAQSMQRSGYATDPRYADKLEQTIQRTIALRRLMV